MTHLTLPIGEPVTGTQTLPDNLRKPRPHVTLSRTNADTCARSHIFRAKQDILLPVRQDQVRGQVRRTDISHIVQIRVSHMQSILRASPILALNGTRMT